MRDINLGRRIAWLRKNRGLEQRGAALGAGLVYGTYQSYEYGNHPSRKNLTKLINFYGCNKSWLLTGEGEPFPGARSKYPDVCGPVAANVSIGIGVSAEATVVREATPSYGGTTRDPAVHLDIPEAIKMATNVLLSNTSYAYALYLNIVQFSRAIMGDDRIVNFEKKYKEMEKRIEELEKSIKVLTEENRALKEWAGESAPIEPDRAAAARTGTDDQTT